MVGPKDVVVGQMQTSQFLFEKLTSDLTDAEFFKAPMPGANHAGWIVGHIACSEDWVTSLLTGSKMQIPEDTHAMFKSGSVCHPDAARYPARRKLDELFRDSRAHALEAIKTFDAARWNDPNPKGNNGPFPTLGSLCALLGFHPFWHIGQLTVCRVFMGKPKVL
jgi:hypothetical protein